jgi:hypothetical protein
MTGHSVAVDGDIALYFASTEMKAISTIEFRANSAFSVL